MENDTKHMSARIRVRRANSRRLGMERESEACVWELGTPFGRPSAEFPERESLVAMRSCCEYSETFPVRSDLDPRAHHWTDGIRSTRRAEFIVTRSSFL